MEKQELKDREAKIIEMAVAFCNKHLDEECASHRSSHTTQPGSNLWCSLIFNVVFRSGNAQ